MYWNICCNPWGRLPCPWICRWEDIGLSVLGLFRCLWELIYTSSQLDIQWHCTGSSKLATVEVVVVVQSSSEHLSSREHHFPEVAQVHVHWIDDAIQPSHLVTLFSFYLQSFPASGSFPMSQFLESGGQSIGASALVLPLTIQDWVL